MVVGGLDRPGRAAGGGGGGEGGGHPATDHGSLGAASGFPREERTLDTAHTTGGGRAWQQGQQPAPPSTLFDALPCSMQRPGLTVAATERGYIGQGGGSNRRGVS